MYVKAKIMINCRRLALQLDRHHDKSCDGQMTTTDPILLQYYFNRLLFVGGMKKTNNIKDHNALGILFSILRIQV